MLGNQKIKRQRPLFARLTRDAAIGAGICLAFSGCAVGPDFKVPDSPVAAGSKSYTSTALPSHTAAADAPAGAAQRFVLAKDIPAQWWEVFHSESLDRLVRLALAQNPTLASAQAALRQAQENYNAQAGTLDYPNVGAQLGATRERASALTAGVPGGAVFNLYNASVTVGYTLDVFGASRRALEGAQANVDYQRYQLEAAYLALTANVVTTAIKEASLRAQLQATHRVLAAQQEQQRLIEKQFALGAIPRTTILSQRNQVAQTAATLPGLEKALAQTRHQLSVYAGRLPSAAGLPEFTLDSLALPRELPVSLPSALARQRPDVRASEALLHAASAQVGVATANQYPQFSLSGSYGSSSMEAGNLFGGGTGIWNLAANLTQPIFNGGALSARRRAAVAAYDQAAAQYRSTLLTAFQNVADSLRALESDAATLKAQAEVEASTRQSLQLASAQYKLGAVSYLSLLDAQRTYQQASIALVQAEAARYADTAALFQSLGGGWWNRQASAAAAQPEDAAAKK